MPMNMSYCRFSNTLEALKECKEALDNGALESLQGEELEAAKELVELCDTISFDHGDR